MGGHRLSGPVRTLLLRGVVAYGEDEVELWSTRPRELVPRLAAKVSGRESCRFDLLKCFAPWLSGRMAARAVSRELALAFVVQDCFGHDRTRGVAGAEEENVIVSGHVLLLCSF